MGGHYGSVQLWCDDRGRVLAAAEAVARDRGLKCLVGPALNGWVGVYPENHGQDETVGEQVAARVGGHALHLLVHDDDVLAYWLWLDGRLVDRYWTGSTESFAPSVAFKAITPVRSRHRLDGGPNQRGRYTRQNPGRSAHPPVRRRGSLGGQGRRRRQSGRACRAA